MDPEVESLEEGIVLEEDIVLVVENLEEDIGLEEDIVLVVENPEEDIGLGGHQDRHLGDMRHLQ